MDIDNISSTKTSIIYSKIVHTHTHTYTHTHTNTHKFNPVSSTLLAEKFPEILPRHKGNFFIAEYFALT